MKRIIICISAMAAIAFAIGPMTFAADTTSAKAKPKQADLEATFKATLTKATLTGRWCSINAPADGHPKLGPEKEDKYTIVGVSKGEDDSWLIRARIQYGKVDIV